VPAGFTVAWRYVGEPVLVADETTTWSVLVGEPQAVQTGTLCRLEVSRNPGEQPLSAGVGKQMVSVGGKPATWGSNSGGQDGLGSTLTWELAPHVLASAECSYWDSAGGHSLPLETIVQFAESVVPVAADDPRIPR
jgi:hypothetical protein